MDHCNDEDTVIIDEICGENASSEEEAYLTRFLTEKDVPGAALNGKDSTVLKVLELKRWLQCRNAPSKAERPGAIPS